ncbi:Methionine aminopeptidase [Thalassoglobus neptunius]|uniref:Methionine aminopeptidase n=2 Tax=Thalassoglobus neptunius TaxID=1938619 RepID=A0A5C5X7Z8_9PLAN|nr:type I methionyl aminopeptidase [Thalassoglobus neptunius]TWT58819.1 Methionine aminopeptidase [Thalassoglobus neptunius]
MRRMIPLRRRNKLPQYNTEAERNGLRAAGQFNAQLLDFLRPHVQPGVSTNTLDRLAEEYTRDHGHIPACLGYNGYSKSICTSVNDVVCHGIPEDRELKEGDIVNVDCSTVVDGWYGDSSETFMIGEVSADAKRIMQGAFDALWIGIDAIHPYSTVIEIGLAISKFGQEQGFGVVENYQGHGIGRKFHQEPGVPHVPFRKSRLDVLTPGVSFTIEPMLNLGGAATQPPLEDGWTVLTEDGSLSAQFEHQILMTEDGPEILTLTENGPQRGHQF